MRPDTTRELHAWQHRGMRTLVLCVMYWPQVANSGDTKAGDGAATPASSTTAVTLKLAELSLAVDGEAASLTLTS